MSFDYCQQTYMSDPRDYASLFDDLPDDISSLCKAVQGTYIHYYTVKSNHPALHGRLKEVDTRRLDLILKRMMELDSRPLMEKRPREKRFIGCCRDASLLLCAMLRHKGIPARLRIGFAKYIGGSDNNFYVDHVVVEYNMGDGWKLVDGEQTDRLIVENGIDFDVQDIPRDQFVVAGQAWQMVQRGEILPKNFGDDPYGSFFRGTWAIRNRLVQDVAGLNLVEMLLWDTWGLMERDMKITDEIKELLNRAAALTVADIDEEEIQKLYADKLFKKPDSFICYSPAEEFHKVTLVF